jgi:hypothetical protein
MRNFYSGARGEVHGSVSEQKPNRIDHQNLFTSHALSVVETALRQKRGTHDQSGVFTRKL